MPLINCIKNKDTCGKIISSSCVSYEGGFNTLLTQDNLPCNADLDDVIKLLSDTIKTIKTSLDLSTFDKGCLTFNKATQPLSALFQVYATQICTLQTLITTLQTTVNGLNASNIFATLELDCLETQGSNCEIGTNTYSILSLLNLFKNEICLLKNS